MPGQFSLDAAICERALDARDARFDGVFFVGITTTGIYCRPICPSRRAESRNRRFFHSTAAAESEGFRPCLRCRPELAPGRALCDAVSRLAHAATHRISAGGLNGRSVAELARELAVSERHLRRAMEREVGVSPIGLAQTHRLLLAKRLLVDTALSVSSVAYASGFQSLRRFNAVFRERYGISPSGLRVSRAPRDRRTGSGHRHETTVPPKEFVRLTLTYRPPFSWKTLVAMLRLEATPALEIVQGHRYGRTVQLDGRSGVIFAEDAGEDVAGTRLRRLTGSGPDRETRSINTHVNVDVSLTLVPVLMPLLAGLRQLFDLDAEPTVVDTCLGQNGLADLVSQRPGLRVPGAMDGFELVWRGLLRGRDAAHVSATELAHRVVVTLGEKLETGVPSLSRLAPSAERIAGEGPSRLAALGVPSRRADAITSAARSVADGKLRLLPGSDVAATRNALLEIDGMGDRLATMIIMRAVRWPDAFPVSDARLQCAAAVPNPKELRECAEKWRPWRAYAALHLWLSQRCRELSVSAMSAASSSRTVETSSASSS
ncbi:MAG: DNA-3-methyladenine glycosylase 2 family protein [Longimicrobiales bacterium]